ncbi:MAG: hypothetical protein ACTSRU_04830 [Candidatus Hodarchaeales archaeon]
MEVKQEFEIAKKVRELNPNRRFQRGDHVICLGEDGIIFKGFVIWVSRNQLRNGKHMDFVHVNYFDDCEHDDNRGSNYADYTFHSDSTDDLWLPTGEDYMKMLWDHSDGDYYAMALNAVEYIDLVPEGDGFYNDYKWDIKTIEKTPAEAWMKVVYSGN